MGIAVDAAGEEARVPLEVPKRIAIPTLSVYTTVVPVGKDDSGGVAVPEDISVVGWYSGSERLGARRGSTVIVGHRDGHDVGAGALFELEKLAPGNRILVAGTAAAREYVVDTVRLVPKTEFAAVSAEVFGSRGPARLVVVSCGGAFDFDIGSYESNVIVTAYPKSTD